MKSSLPEQSKNTRSKLFLLAYTSILIFAFFKFYASIFDEKIDLNGDNAGYYILGNSLASGEGFTNIQSYEKTPHNHFPPGYPFIIATTIHLFSSDISTIKRVNGLLLFLAIAISFMVVYQLTSNIHISFVVCLFSVSNYHLLDYATMMMSEIPFLFFSMLCVWGLLNLNCNKPIYNNILFYGVLICIICAYYIRTAGIALLISIIIFFLLRKHWKYALTMALGFTLFILPWQIRSYSLGGSSYVSSLFRKNPYRPELGAMEWIDWLKRIWTNTERYITREIPSGVFNFINVEDYNAAYSLGEWVLGITLLAVMIVGMLHLKKYIDIILLYLTGTFGILILWPDVWFGVRFLIPLIPLLSFLFVYGCIELLNLFQKKLFGISFPNITPLILVFISLVSMSFYTAPLKRLKEKAQQGYPRNYANYFTIAKWIKQNTAENSLTSCRKGQLFYVYSKKYVNKYLYTLNTEEQITYLDNQGVDYVVLEQLGYASTPRYLYPAILRYPAKFKTVLHLKNPDTYLFQFLPNMGYTGEWMNGKRHGHGTYTWETGEKYEGLWSNGVKNGQGILYLANGEQLQGTWKNNFMEGTFTLLSKEGETIEKSIYRNNKKEKILEKNR